MFLRLLATELFEAKLLDQYVGNTTTFHPSFPYRASTGASMQYHEVKAFLAERKEVMKDPDPWRRVRYGIDRLMKNVSGLIFVDSPHDVLRSIVAEELAHVSSDKRHIRWRDQPLCLEGGGKTIVESWVQFATYESGIRWGDFLEVLYVEVIRPRRPIPEYEQRIPALPTPWVHRRK
jgi:hypothetical protein